MPYELIASSSKLNYQFNWDDGWLADGDSIASHQWSIQPVSGSPETPVLTGAGTDTVFIEGMQAGMVYRLTDHVVTTAGLEDDRIVTIRCDDIR